ncbi:MAG: cyclic nucleotide-binding domain-containing protein [Nitrospinae bacterium]|nr:cyclic nucleotide-binding domain-containing protein [Nitrospinota bacterium]
MDIVEILKQNGLTAGMSDEQAARLASLAVCEEYAPGSSLIIEDDTGRDIFIVYDGLVSFEMKNTLANSSGNSADNKYEILFYKGIAGELSFIDGHKRSATVVAMDEVKAIRLPFQKLSALLENDKDIGFIFLRNLCGTLCRKVRHSSDQLKNQMLL